MIKCVFANFRQPGEFTIMLLEMDDQVNQVISKKLGVILSL